MSKAADSRSAAHEKGPLKVSKDAPAKARSDVASDKEREREQRLAAALRENLRKRKAQARARSAKGEASSGKEDN